MPQCTHTDQIHDVKLHTRGCEERLKTGDTWVHLRMCLHCGHVGCCDSSKNKHATKHFKATTHAIVAIAGARRDVGLVLRRRTHAGVFLGGLPCWNYPLACLRGCAGKILRMGKLRTSAMAPGTVQSEIRAMSVLSEEASAINMAQGICDTEVPPVVREAAKAAIDEGNNIYTRLDGIARLRDAVAADWEQRRGFPVDPDREVMVTSGATGAFYAAAMALLDPGDEAILFEPLYGYHAGTLRSMHVKPVIVPLGYDTWTLDTDAVRAAVTSKTRAIVINTPGNPSGKVFSQTEFESLAELALEHDLFVFCDEIYEHFVYPGHRHISMATLPGMRERTITFSGFSKTYSVTGWRVGYLVADPRWTPSIGYFHDLVYICAPSPFQHGCAAGLEHLPPSFYTDLAGSHEGKRTRTLAALTDAGLKPHTPDGAYYILADATPLIGSTAAEKARDLLARTGVAAVAGSAFFRKGGGENLLRFCFAKRDADLDEACRRLRTLRTVAVSTGRAASAAEIESE